MRLKLCITMHRCEGAVEVVRLADNELQELNLLLVAKKILALK